MVRKNMTTIAVTTPPTRNDLTAPYLFIISPPANAPRPVPRPQYTPCNTPKMKGNTGVKMCSACNSTCWMKRCPYWY